MKLENPNFTQLPNIVLDSMYDFTDAELRVALCICRQTFGWHRESKKMSISFMMKATGMSHQGVIKGVFRMLEKGILRKVQNGDSFDYSLVVNAVDTLSTPLIAPLNAVDYPPLNAVDTNKERVLNKGGKESPPFSKSERISKEQELHRATQELKGYGQLNDYHKENATYARILELRAGVKQLRKLLGVVA